MSDYNPKEKIYLTYKTRITSEARIRLTATLLNILVSWYSFCLIVISLIDVTENYHIAYANILIISLSVGIFGLSLFIYGEKYFERASQFRECYLKLQKLYNSDLDQGKMMSGYADILAQYENQSDNDYDYMVFDAWWRRQSLRNATGPIEMSWAVAIKVAVQRFFRYGFFVILFVSPVILGASLMEQLETPELECAGSKCLNDN